MNLSSACGLGPADVVAITGGGGKTTILYRLAAEVAAAGGRVIVTGTTRFTPPEGAVLPPSCFAASEAELLAAVGVALEGSPLVVAGAGWGNQGRILPVDSEWLTAMARLPGVTAVLAEADGSAGRPFKAPAAHEPVVAPSTTLLLSVVGADVLGKPLEPAYVHRPEIVAALSGATPGAPVDEEMIVRVLLHERGGRKGLPAGARWLPVLNKVETEAQRAAARRIGALLLAGGAARVVIARAAHDPPVLEVLTPSGSTGAGREHS